MRHQRLNEGLRAGDLEDLVLPLLSVDEFESKIDENAIVLGFYISDHDAAIDLNRFIQKSPIDILDCDISPAPDQHGFYMVFVEILRNVRIIDNIMAVVMEVSALTNINKWKAQYRNKKDLILLNKENLKANLEKTATVEESILHFLAPSALSNVSINGSNIIIEGHGGKWQGNIVGFGPTIEVMTLNEMQHKPMSLSFKNIAVNERLAIMLGEGWFVSRFGEIDVLQYGNDPNTVLLLKA